MIRYIEWMGQIDPERPADIDLRLPYDAEVGYHVMVLIERLDQIGSEFQAEVNDTLGAALATIGDRADAVRNQARVWVSDAAMRVEQVWARVTSATGGWFRVRIAAIKANAFNPNCHLCRKVLAMAVGACFAILGVPMPDITLVDIDLGLAEALTEVIQDEPVGPFLAQIDHRLPGILTMALTSFDLVQQGLRQLYAWCCKGLRFCA